MEEEKIEGAQENAEQQITEKPAEEQKAEEVQKESRYQRRIDELTRARREAEERAIRAEERTRMLERTPVAPQSDEGKVGELTKEKWEEWHAENPVEAMRYLARTEAKKESDAKANEMISQMNRDTRKQEILSEVYKSHPELRDVMEGRKAPEDVPFYQVFDEVARENPDANQLVRGPMIVMKEAERRVKEKEMADRDKKIADQAGQNERARQEQVDAGYIAGASPRSPSSVSVKLSTEEERVARKMDMSPEEYAKNKGGK